jgi:hypothetical protein
VLSSLSSWTCQENSSGCQTGCDPSLYTRKGIFRRARCDPDQRRHRIFSEICINWWKAYLAGPLVPVNEPRFYLDVTG